MWSSRFAAIVLASSLAACGFQLRGDPAVGLKTIYVPGGGVAQEIRRTLAAGPTRVVNNAREAEVHLRIVSEARDKQVHTITGQGRVFEFELRLSVRYELVAPGRELPLIPSTEATSRRIITYNEAAPSAKEVEEQILFKDMQVEIAERILRQVAAAKRQLS